MKHSLEDRVLALAGIFQSAALTDATAWHGRSNPPSMDATLKSLFAFDAPNVESIFGGREAVREGLQLVAKVLGNEASPDELRLTNYVIALLNHAKRALNDPALMERLRKGLERALQQKSHFDDWDLPVLANLADLYTQTIGNIEPRIMVRGEPMQLQDTGNIHLIRALLLAGIRSAALWHQVGGTKWQLVFSRRKLAATAREMLVA